MICPTRAKLRYRHRSKACIAFDLTLIGLRRLAFNPTIDKLPDRVVLSFSGNSIRDVFGPVSVLDKISFFHVAWGLLTMR